MRRRGAGERSALRRRLRPPPPPALTADPLRGEEALRLLQEAACLIGLVGLDGAHSDGDAPLRLVPVGLHGGGSGRMGGAAGTQ